MSWGEIGACGACWTIKEELSDRQEEADLGCGARGRSESQQCDLKSLDINTLRLWQWKASATYPCSLSRVVWVGAGGQWVKRRE